MNRPFAPLFILVSLSLTLIACGGGSSTPPPPPPAISVGFSTPPPTPMNISASANIVATVTNDSSNSGVTFSCLPGGQCGTFTAVTSTSATYTAPNAIPTGGSVNIIATSVKDATKSTQSTVTINVSLVSVQITAAVPGVLQAGATLNLTAATTNDPTNAGVVWSCTPAPPLCGTFSNISTTSATYTAPAPPSGRTVTIIATAVAQPTNSASVGPIGIEGVASLASLKGQYAFLALSPTGSRGTAAWVGSVKLDGAGNLTAVGATTFAGVEDVVSPVRNDQADGIYPTATNAASKYTVDASGHGQITMTTFRGEVLTLSLVITSVNSSGLATHAEVIEADGVGGEAGDPGSGTLDLQDPTAFTNASLAHTYSFTMTGVQNAVNNPPESLGGVVNLSTPTAVSGSVDLVSGGTFSSLSAGLGSQIDTLPDANGRGTLHIVLPSPASTRSLTYYVVNSKVLRVFENSNISFTGGSMYSQGTATTALLGTYVYQHSGWSTAGRTVAVGQLNASSGVIASGISDANSGGLSAITPSLAKAVIGNYTASTTEPGTINLLLTDAGQSTASTFNVYPVDPGINILDPNNSSGGGGGALLLHTDANLNGTGILIPQVSPTIFSMNYALNLVNAIATPTPNEVDLIGLLSSDGTANFAGTTNLADYTQAAVTPNPQLNAPLSGTFASDTSHSGRYTGSFSITSLVGGYSFPAATSTASATKSTLGVAIYQATPSQAFVVETDSQAITLGQMVQQILP